MVNQNEHIKNILTLRYDPTRHPSIPHKAAQDFTPTHRDSEGFKLEKILIDVLMDELQDVDEIAIALSSGVDSMLLAKMIRSLFPEKHMCAYHYCGINNELASVVKFCQQEKIRLATIENFKVTENISSFVEITEEPIWDGFNAPLYSEAKKDGYNVLVTGDGADEILAGYVFRYKLFNPMDTSVEAQAWAYIDCHRRDWVDDQANMFHKDMKFDWNDIMQLVLPWFDNDLTSMGKIFLADYNGKLVHNFIPRDRHFENYFGITKIAPYLNWKVSEFCCNLEYDNKILGEIGKVPLRKISGRYGVTPRISKLGFSHDVVSEWNKIGTIKVNSIMNKNNQIYKQKIINREWVQRHVLKDGSDPTYVNKFMQLLALEYWLMMNR